MIDKRYFSINCIIFGFFISIMTILIVLLFFEYRFFCHHAQELVQLKKQYNEYINALQKKNDDTIIDELVGESPLLMAELSAAEASDDPDDDDEYVDESLLDYIQSQNLDPLMTTIDMNRWSSYTDQVRVATPEVQQNIVQPLVKETIKTKMRAIGKPIKNFGFMWPIDINKFWLSSLFGPRKRIDGTWGFHHGIDMAAIKGTHVKSARAGTIIEASFQVGYGNTVVIKHNEIVKTRYAHLHTIRAYVGQKVKQGAIVGTVGETGFIRKKGKDGSHLHFEVYERGKRINPLHCLPQAA